MPTSLDDKIALVLGKKDVLIAQLQTRIEQLEAELQAAKAEKAPA